MPTDFSWSLSMLYVNNGRNQKFARVIRTRVLLQLFPNVISELHIVEFKKTYILTLIDALRSIRVIKELLKNN